MGYSTHFTGELTLSRPLTWEEFSKTPETADFTLRREATKTHTPTGILEVISGTAIIPREGDEVRAYDAERQLRELVGSLPAGVTVSGCIRGAGESAGDVRRYVFHNGALRELKARLVWEDGHSEDGRA